MVPITIGVPVYNGADLLDECLACLARQTFRDFKVLIFDNASTDATGEIARGWAARDARFHYFRQAKNLGAGANFMAALDAADSPWFLWRADDDLCADNYLEVLYRLATSAPGCQLAVGTVVSHDLDGGRRNESPPPKDVDPRSLGGRLRMLLGSHASWLYGLWDTATIRAIEADIIPHFPFPFAADHLALYGPIIDGAVRATTETHFIQRVRRTAATPRKRTRMPYALMAEVHGGFRRQLRRIRAQRRPSPLLRAALLAVEPFYLRQTVFKWLKMFRTWLREQFGVVGSMELPGHYFDRIDPNCVSGGGRTEVAETDFKP